MKSRLWVSLELCLSLLGLGASHVKGPVTFTVDVPPVKWKALKLRNLPKEAVVGVNVRTSGADLRYRSVLRRCWDSIGHTAES